MPRIGIKHPVAAVIATYEAGKRPTYTKGMVLGKLTEASMDIETSNVEFYADDHLDETDQDFVSGSVSISLNDLNYGVDSMLIGTSYNEESGEIVDALGDQAPYVGYGHIITNKINGVRVYEAEWYLRTKFHRNGSSATTKGNTTAFAATTIEGVFHTVDGYHPVEGKDGEAWRERKRFTSETEAIAWINGKAGIADD